MHALIHLEALSTITLLYCITDLLIYLLAAVLKRTLLDAHIGENARFHENALPSLALPTPRVRVGVERNKSNCGLHFFYFCVLLCVCVCMCVCVCVCVCVGVCVCVWVGGWVGGCVCVGVCVWVCVCVCVCVCMCVSCDMYKKASEKTYTRHEKETW